MRGSIARRFSPPMAFVDGRANPESQYFCNENGGSTAWDGIGAPAKRRPQSRRV
jgi:hypothetical protein